MSEKKTTRAAKPPEPTRKPWTAPTLEALPPLTELTLMTGESIWGGGTTSGGGGTVFF